jgi:hypothetical protein
MLNQSAHCKDHVYLSVYLKQLFMPYMVIRMHHCDVHRFHGPRVSGQCMRHVTWERSGTRILYTRFGSYLDNIAICYYAI